MYVHMYVYVHIFTSNEESKKINSNSFSPLVSHVDGTNKYMRLWKPEKLQKLLCINVCIICNPT